MTFKEKIIVAEKNNIFIPSDLAGDVYKRQVTEDREELVKQSYSNGNQMKTIDTFITDESGEIMTVKPLRSARYRIYAVSYTHLSR